MNRIIAFIKTKQGIVIILAVFIIAGSIGIFSLSSGKDSNKAKDKDIKIAKEKESKAKKELAKEEDKKKEAEKELEEAKKSGNTDAIKKAEEKLEASKKAVESKKQSVAKASTEASKPAPANKVEPKSESPKPSTPSAPPKKKERVWVVDKPAYSETIQVPVEKSRKYWWVTYENTSDIRKFYNAKELDNYIGTTLDPIVRWGGPKFETYTEYENKVVNHEEEGHWEER